MVEALWIVALFVTVLAVTTVCARFRLAEPLVLTVVGVALSFLPFIPTFTLSPDMVLIGLLPPLLYAAASNASLTDFRSEIESITMLSVFLVIFTAFGVRLVAWWLLPIPYAAALALGAIVAPPDAVAATAVARTIGLPRRVVLLLEGESLVNDATAIVLLRTSILAIGGSVTALGVAESFLISALGGIVIGVVAALVISKAHSLLEDATASTGLSLLTPWIAYLPAERVHASGVLAVVVAGLLIAHKAPYRQRAIARLSSTINWQTIQFMLENAVFLLIGLGVQGIVQRLSDSELGLGRFALAATAILATVILLRPLWLFAGRRLPRRVENRMTWSELAVVSWAGMRGVVTLAAAFVLPASTPYREVLVAIALVVVGGTLLLQGATLPWLSRRLNVQGPDPREDAMQEAQVLRAASRAGLAVLEEARADERRNFDDDVYEELSRRSTRRVNSVWEQLRNETRAGAHAPGEIYRQLRMDMLGAERGAVLAIRDQGEVPNDVLRRVMTQLDVEESTLDQQAVNHERVISGVLRAPTSHSGLCTHLDSYPKARAKPNADHCLECDRDGTDPVHLRMCMECGHVGCCDSSPGLHATRHFEQTGHPVMKSFEPGEKWRWCYEDELIG